jgi:phosphoglycolate phosphatase-like HAD superfamily hydrolase
MAMAVNAGARGIGAGWGYHDAEEEDQQTRKADKHVKQQPAPSDMFIHRYAPE